MAVADNGTPESLAANLNWLYGPKGVYPGNVPCKCEHAFIGLGVLQGINMGKGWVRTTTHPLCPHHKPQPKWGAMTMREREVILSENRIAYLERVIAYEARVIEANALSLKALGAGRRRILTESVKAMRAVAGGRDTDRYSVAAAYRELDNVRDGYRDGGESVKGERD